jgi:hypothetical protein
VHPSSGAFNARGSGRIIADEREVRVDPGREAELKLGQGHIVRAGYAEMLKRTAIHMALNGGGASTNVPVDDLVIEEEPKPPPVRIKRRTPQNRKERREEARRRRRRNG